MATTLHVNWAVRSVAIVRARLQHIPRDHIPDDRVGCELVIEVRGFHHLVDLLIQRERRRTDGLSGYGVLLTIVLAADTSFACAGITAARAAGAACEAIGSGVFIVAADAALTDAHVSAAGRVDVASEIHTVGVGTRLELLVFARGVRRHRIQVSLVSGAALASVRGTGIPATLAVLVALEIDSIIIDAAFGVHRRAKTATALVVVIANVVVPTVVAHMQLGALLRGVLEQ